MADDTIIEGDGPENRLGDPPDNPGADYFPWEMYDVGDDVRTLIGWIDDPTKRSLAIERIRSLTAAEKQKALEARRDYQLNQIKRTIRHNVVRLDRQEQRCADVLSGEKRACRSLADLESELRQEILKLKLWVMGGLVSRLVIPTVVGILVGIAVALITGSK